MEQPKDQKPIDLSEVDSLNNLDTARMALRWALERIHSVEKLKNEISEKAESTSAALRKTRVDLDTLQGSMVAALKQANEREVYYSKVEELLSLKMAGQLDVATLLKQQADTAQLQEFLINKQNDLEKRYEARRRELEGEFERFVTDKQKEAQDQIKQAQESVKQQRLTFEREHATRLVSIHEGEVRLAAQEKVLAERQTNFEQFCLSQREQLQHEIRTFRDEVDGQVRFQVENAEGRISEKYAHRERIWDEEKRLLLKDLADWQRKASEGVPRILELENRLAKAEETAQRASESSLKEVVWRKELAEREREIESNEKSSLLKELKIWRQRAQETFEKLADSEKNLGKTDEDAHRTERALAAETLKRTALETSLREAEARHHAELGAAQAAFRKHEEELLKRSDEALAEKDQFSQTHLPRILELERQLAETVERAHKAEAEVKHQAEWRARLEKWEAEQQQRTHDMAGDAILREQEFKKITDALEAQYKGRLAQAEARFQSREEELLKRSQETLARQDQLVKDQAPRILELETLLTEAAERALKAETEITHQAEWRARFEAREAEYEQKAKQAERGYDEQVVALRGSLEDEFRQRESELLKRVSDQELRAQALAAEILRKDHEFSTQIESFQSRHNEDSLARDADWVLKLADSEARHRQREEELLKGLAELEEKGRVSFAEQGDQRVALERKLLDVHEREQKALEYSALQARRAEQLEARLREREDALSAAHGDWQKKESQLLRREAEAAAEHERRVQALSDEVLRKDHEFKTRMESLQSQYKENSLVRDADWVRKLAESQTLHRQREEELLSHAAELEAQRVQQLKGAAEQAQKREGELRAAYEASNAQLETKLEAQQAEYERRSQASAEEALLKDHEFKTQMESFQAQYKENSLARDADWVLKLEQSEARHRQREEELLKSLAEMERKGRASSVEQGDQRVKLEQELLEAYGRERAAVEACALQAKRADLSEARLGDIEASSTQSEARHRQREEALQNRAAELEAQRVQELKAAAEQAERREGELRAAYEASNAQWAKKLQARETEQEQRVQALASEILHKDHEFKTQMESLQAQYKGSSLARDADWVLKLEQSEARHCQREEELLKSMAEMERKGRESSVEQGDQRVKLEQELLEAYGRERAAVEACALQSKRADLFEARLGDLEVSSVAARGDWEKKESELLRRSAEAMEKSGARHRQREEALQNRAAELEAQRVQELKAAAEQAEKRDGELRAAYEESNAQWAKKLQAREAEQERRAQALAAEILRKDHEFKAQMESLQAQYKGNSLARDADWVLKLEQSEARHRQREEALLKTLAEMEQKGRASSAEQGDQRVKLEQELLEAYGRERAAVEACALQSKRADLFEARLGDLEVSSGAARGDWEKKESELLRRNAEALSKQEQRAEMLAEETLRKEHEFRAQMESLQAQYKGNLLARDADWVRKVAEAEARHRQREEALQNRAAELEAQRVQELKAAAEQAERREGELRAAYEESNVQWAKKLEAREAEQERRAQALADEILRRDHEFKTRTESLQAQYKGNSLVRDADWVLKLEQSEARHRQREDQALKRLAEIEEQARASHAEQGELRGELEQKLLAAHGREQAAIEAAELEAKHAQQLGARLRELVERETEWSDKLQALESQFAGKAAESEERHRRREEDLLKRLSELEEIGRRSSSEQGDRHVELERKLLDAHGREQAAIEASALQLKRTQLLEARLRDLQTHLREAGAASEQVQIRATQAELSALNFQKLLAQSQEQAKKAEIELKHQAEWRRGLEAKQAEQEQKARQAAEEHLKKQLELEAEKQAIQRQYHDKELALRQETEAVLRAKRAELDAAFAAREKKLLDEMTEIGLRSGAAFDEHGAQRIELERQLVEARLERKKATEAAGREAKRVEALEAAVAESESRRAVEARRALELEKLLSQTKEQFQKAESEIEHQAGWRARLEAWEREQEQKTRAAAEARQKMKVELEQKLLEARSGEHRAEEAAALEAKARQLLEARVKEMEASYERRLSELQARAEAKEAELLRQSQELGSRSRDTAQGHVPQILALEKKVVEAEAAAREALQSLSREMEFNKILAAREAELKAQYQNRLAELQGRSKQNAMEIVGREASLEEHERLAKEREAQLKEESRALEQRARDLELRLKEDESLRLAAADWRLKAEQAYPKLVDMESRLAEAAAAANHAQAMAKRAEDALAQERELRAQIEQRTRELPEEHRSRLIEVEKIKATVEAERAALVEEANKWRQKAQEHLPRMLELERRVVISETDAQNAGEIIAKEETVRRALDEKERELNQAYLARLEAMDAKTLEMQQDMERRVAEFESRAGQIESLERELSAQAAEAKAAAEERERALAAKEAELSAKQAEIERGQQELESETQEFAELVKEYESKTQREPPQG